MYGRSCIKPGFILIGDFASQNYSEKFLHHIKWLEGEFVYIITWFGVLFKKDSPSNYSKC